MAGSVDFLCTSSSEEKQSKMNTMEDSSIPLYKGILRRSWVGKCVVLQNASGVIVASGICHNVSSNAIIGSLELFDDTHVMVQISSSLCEDDVQDKWRYSV